MAPPLKVPGGYVPAPSVQAPMSVEEMYRGIVPSAPPAISSRTVSTVPINPTTGMPYVPTINASAQFGSGIGAAGSGSVGIRAPKQFVPNAVPGPDPVPKYQDRLPAIPAGLPLAAPIATAKAGLGTMGRGSGSLTLPPRVPKADDGIVNLDALALGDIAGQRFADSEGKPIRDKTGKVWYPGGKAPAGAVSGSLGTNDMRGPLGRALGLKSPGLGGLFGSLFGGSSGGGLFGGNRAGAAGVSLVPGLGAAQAASRPAPPYTTTPFQEDRFQTTTGALMPASMNNDRWKNGY